MAFTEGDFVKVDYSLWRLADNELVLTTEKKLAEEKGIYSEKARYAPQLIVLGKDSNPKALWEAIKGMKEGEAKSIELEPKDAFGERNQELVRVMPIADFRKREIDPKPGMQIEIDGAIATVKSVNSGRVVVDANHSLAGERVRYDLKVIARLEKEEEKARAIAETYDLAPEKVEISNSVIKIGFGKNAINNEYYTRNKLYMIYAMLKYLEKASKVVIEEEYERQ